MKLYLFASVWGATLAVTAQPIAFITSPAANAVTFIPPAEVASSRRLPTVRLPNALGAAHHEVAFSRRRMIVRHLNGQAAAHHETAFLHHLPIALLLVEQQVVPPEEIPQNQNCPLPYLHPRPRSPDRLPQSNPNRNPQHRAVHPPEVTNMAPA
jgi:hypothetical protein